MNKLEIRGNWNIIMGMLKQKWANFTNDELQYLAGKMEELQGRIQKRNGQNRKQVENAVKQFHSENGDDKQCCD